MGAHCELSLYEHGEITADVAIVAIKKLTGNFSQTNAVVFDCFLELAREQGWSNKRLNDAVNNALCTIRYPSLTVADLMSYDRRRKIYTNAQMNELVNKGIKAYSLYNKTEINGKFYWLGEEI